MEQLVKIESLLRGNTGDPNSSRLVSDSESNLLISLSKLGYIAGGSVVYALCDFVPKNSVGDVDVFFNSAENFMKAIDAIQENSGPNPPIFSASKTGELNDYISVVNIKVDTFTVHIQLIYRKFSDAEDLISSFDYDYVQCAIHEGILYATKVCREAHMQRKIMWIHKNQLETQRSAKAIQKGFMCPLLGGPIFNSTNPNPRFNGIGLENVDRKNITLKNIKTMDCNAYFDTMKDDGYLSHELSYKCDELVPMSNLTIIGFRSHHETTNNSEKYGKFVISMGGNKLTHRQYVSVEMNVISWDDVNNVTIEHSDIFDIFAHIKIKLTNSGSGELIKGKNIVVIEAHTTNGIFTAVIIEVNNVNMVPIKFSNNLPPGSQADKFEFTGYNEPNKTYYIMKNNMRSLIWKEILLLNKMCADLGDKLQQEDCKNILKGLLLNVQKMLAYMRYLEIFKETGDERASIWVAVEDFYDRLEFEADFPLLNIIKQPRSYFTQYDTIDMINYFNSLH